MYQEIIAVGVIVLIAIGAFKAAGPIMRHFDEELFPEKKEERRN